MLDIISVTLEIPFNSCCWWMPRKTKLCLWWFFDKQLIGRSMWWCRKIHWNCVWMYSTMPYSKCLSMRTTSHEIYRLVFIWLISSEIVNDHLDPKTGHSWCLEECPAPECGEHEQWNECGTCEETKCCQGDHCGNDSSPCSTVCNPRCECAEGNSFKLCSLKLVSAKMEIVTS